MSTTVVANPIARLDRSTQCRVLCGRLANGQARCNGQLAEIVQDDANDFAEDPIRTLEFEAGWYEINGVWTQGNYARKQVERGGMSASRRTYMGPDQFGTRDSDCFDPSYPAAWPVKAKCPEPNCGMVNLLTRQSLRVDEGYTTAVRLHVRQQGFHFWTAGLLARLGLRNGVPAC